MRFVDQEDLVAVTRRQVTNRFPQLPDFVDAAIGGRVNLLHIDGISRGNFEARGAGAIRRHRGTLKTIERFGQNARGGRLSHAAAAGENVPVRNAVGEDGILQGVGYKVLAHDVVKSLRPVFAGDNLVGHGRKFWILDFRFWIWNLEHVSSRGLTSKLLLAFYDGRAATASAQF